MAHCCFALIRQRVKLSLILAFFSLFYFTDAARAQTNAAVPGVTVKIESGIIAGKLLPGGVNAYLAIPYAAPPVGDMRWKAPQPVKTWAGIRPASQYCAPCTQRDASSEDCLYLNLWAPAKRPGKKLAVIVYIFGGAFNGGSASGSSISGETLAQKGVIYINFNYRLGVIGNLSLPELTAESPHKASGNFAHLDELALLQWVHRNIEKFGGDPANVTLMGQSSGAIDVCYLQASPLAHGLIHKVVALSGATFPGGPWVIRTLKEGEQAGLNLQQKTGVKSLAEMRALPFEQLVKASGKDVGEPVVADGYVLPQASTQIFANNSQNHVPALLNSCRDEGFGPLGNAKTIEELRTRVQSLAGNKADEILKLYPVSSDSDAHKVGTQVAQGSGIGKQMLQWAIAQANSRSPAYVSMFSRGERAGHGSDVPYWLGRVLLINPDNGTNTSYTPEDVELANKMSDALVAFAKTGNPDTKAVNWPQYDPQNPYRMDFGDQVKAVPIDKGIYYFIANPDLQLGSMGGPRNGPPKN